MTMKIDKFFNLNACNGPIFRTFFEDNLEKIKAPSLLYLQKKSYNDFLYSKSPYIYSLHNSLKNFFPIKNVTETIILKYKGYTLKKTTLSVEECKIHGLTYSASLIVRAQLYVYGKNQKKIMYKKHQEVYICEIPVMTSEGSFIVNGTERVVISQLCRAPGAYFFVDTVDGGRGYTLSIVPYIGSWVEVILTKNNFAFVRIDRKKKFPLTLFLLALGVSIDKIHNYFNVWYKLQLNKNGTGTWLFSDDFVEDTPSLFTIKCDKKIIIYKNEIITKKKKLLLRNKTLTVCIKELVGKVVASTVFYGDVILLRKGCIVFESTIAMLLENNIFNITVSHNHTDYGDCMINTLIRTEVETKSKALVKIHNILKPNEPTTVKIAEKFFYDMLLNPKKYILSTVGREKINSTTNTHNRFNQALTKEDILSLISKLFKTKTHYNIQRNSKYFVDKGKTPIDIHLDDIDHIGNKRLKHAGELVASKIYSGLIRVKKLTREKLSSVETSKLQPREVLATTSIALLVKEFFCSSQFSQFMDQNNPLSSATHKRRISSIGPGGLTRERVNIEARDVHITNYGRICPIETPEGKNIGLVNSLALFVKINKNGILKTPYRKINGDVVTNIIKYFTAYEEEKYSIRQVNFDKDAVDPFGYVLCRNAGMFKLEKKLAIDFIDVSSQQILSVATALIPFLEHNDANRALMGSNMQRQAVPLLFSERPFIGTGIEHIISKDSGVVLFSNKNGIVSYVDSETIVINNLCNYVKPRNTDVRVFRLKKYYRSNQNTSINQKSIVKKNMYVKKNDIIADGPAMVVGELSLGKNICVAFIPWYGYNFEDSIVVSERLVKNDVLTSVNIEEFVCIVRDTKLGKEKITRDIPDVSFDSTKKLDDNGIIKEGTQVISGSILVGKVTPTEEVKLSPEEKLLSAVFGEKLDAVKNTSLVVPPGVCGVVSKVVVLTRSSDMINTFYNEKKCNIEKDYHHILSQKKYTLFKTVHYYLSNVKNLQTTIAFLGTSLLEELNEKFYDRTIKILLDIFEYNIQVSMEKKFNKLKRINNKIGIQQGVLQIVKIFVTTKRQLQPGDKISGRHGNKGVVSYVAKTEDMPYLFGGCSVDMILNPLSIPSRMNVGQLLETHLGLVLKKLNDFVIDKKSIKEKVLFVLNNLFTCVKNNNLNLELSCLNEFEYKYLLKNLVDSGFFVACSPFDSIKQQVIQEILSFCKIPATGLLPLIDGTTGEMLDRFATVGYLYMLKLNHLADDKLHARSIGPYNIITQQPLGGKAQFGGQRFGEMEVWALEAFGAAYTLQEIITVKSDDIVGRASVFHNIVNGQHYYLPHIPESFKVLIEELRALGLEVTYS